MKKINYILLLIIGSLVLTGCIKRDTYENVDIYTTIYPIEYIAKRLYGEHSNIYSIYPDGVNVADYELTEKQIKDYSKASIFIFNGLSQEKNLVVPMFNYNNNLKIIDTSLSMEYTHDMAELWLDPSNFLKTAQNVKSGFHEIINNHYLKNNISDNYEQLKIEISNLDAKLSLITSNANNNTIVVGNDLFLFLEKYNFNVISLDNSSGITDRRIQDVRNLIRDGSIDYIYVKQNSEINEVVKSIQEETDVEIIELHGLENIGSKETSANEDYISIMNDMIDSLKLEINN